MPLIIAALWGALRQLLGTFIGAALFSIGIGYVTYTGVDVSLAWVKASFLSGLSGMPANALAIAGMLKVGVCVSMLLSAVSMRLTLAGLTSGTLKRMVLK